eukprot:GEMP01029756.1.p1 GENE.GEMP01029756.1~~GEMP01029756.1.p1  ORF type:complete len:176 (+),score=24.92 GEMP01029756.1:401-928(+)
MFHKAFHHVNIQLQHAALRSSDGPSDDTSLSFVDIVLCMTAMILAFFLGAITFNLLTFHSAHNMKEPKRSRTTGAKRPTANTADSPEVSSEPEASSTEKEKRMKHHGPKSRSLSRPQLGRSYSNLGPSTRPSVGARSADESVQKDARWSRWKQLLQSSERFKSDSTSGPDGSANL